MTRRPLARSSTFGPNISTDPKPPCNRTSGEPVPKAWYASWMPFTWASVETLVRVLIAINVARAIALSPARSRLAVTSAVVENRGDMAADREALIAKYREGPNRIAETVLGLSEELLDYQPADGGWSAREVVHHTADSELTSAIRLRRLMAEERPEIIGYDGDEFARRLFYAERPVQPSLDAIRAARETSASLLERLREDDWRRAGTHSEIGPYSIDKWLAIYAVHCHEHAEQIERAVAEARAR